MDKDIKSHKSSTCGEEKNEQMVERAIRLCTKERCQCAIAELLDE